MGMRLDELANRLGAELRGDGSLVIDRCATIESADEHALTFVSNQKYARLMKKTAAGAILLAAKNVARAPADMALLIVDDPYYALREAVIILHGFRRQPPPGVSDLAFIDPSAKIGNRCSIQPFACIGPDVVIGNGTVIHPHASVGPGSTVGAECILYAGVHIYDGCTIGDRVIIHAGSVIGSDGFGFAPKDGAHHKIPQVGTVVIEDDVEVGANCSIQCGSVGPTIVGAGTKMSDLVNIGHGSTIGKHNLLVSQVGIAGSVTTGDYVAIGGQAGVAGHLEIGERARIAAKSGIVSNIPAGAEYGGSPAAIPMSDAKNVAMEVIRLPELVQHIEQMRKRIDALEARLAEAAPKT